MSAALRPEEARRVTVRTSGGVELSLRSLSASDEGLVRSFVPTLSTETLMLRFMSPRRPPDDELVERLMRFEPRRDIAVVALAGEPAPRLAGLCRALGIGPGRAELALVVGDPFQGRGVGAALLERVVDLARSRGITVLWGLVSSENTAMLGLARRRGYEVGWAPSLCAYEVRIGL